MALTALNLQKWQSVYFGISILRKCFQKCKTRLKTKGTNNDFALIENNTYFKFCSLGQISPSFDPLRCLIAAAWICFARYSLYSNFTDTHNNFEIREMFYYISIKLLELKSLANHILWIIDKGKALMSTVRNIMLCLKH